MEVNVKLFASLRDGRFKEKSIELGNDNKVADVISKCDLPPEEIAISMVNGRDVETDYQLQNGDTVSLFPPVGGG